MSNYHFDEIHNRRISGDMKYNCAENVIPMWVADMDFKAPKEVTEALINTAEHGIFGYTQTDEEYDSLVRGWYQRRFGWDISDDYIVKTPGVVFALGAIIHALTEIGDSVMICQPVYYPFTKIVTNNKRKLVISELKETDGRYEIDFADFEDKIIKNKVRLFLLCSPHNPVGRVWTKEELNEIGRICLKHGVYIAADEIHSDFVFQGSTHTPIASLSKEVADITITCTAPSKTFNLAGLQGSNVFTSRKDIGRKIDKAIASTGYFAINTMAIASAKAVYRYGDEWLDELLQYLEESKTILKNAFPSDYSVSLVNPEGTYLAWLDCQKLNLTSAELHDLFLHKARVWLHKGDTFGKSGNGFMRMNFACPHSVLNEAIDRIKSSL